MQNPPLVGDTPSLYRAHGPARSRLCFWARRQGEARALELLSASRSRRPACPRTTRSRPAGYERRRRSRRVAHSAFILVSRLAVRLDRPAQPLSAASHAMSTFTDLHLVETGADRLPRHPAPHHTRLAHQPPSPLVEEWLRAPAATAFERVDLATVKPSGIGHNLFVHEPRKCVLLPLSPSRPPKHRS